MSSYLTFSPLLRRKVGAVSFLLHFSCPQGTSRHQGFLLKQGRISRLPITPRAWRGETLNPNSETLNNDFRISDFGFRISRAKHGHAGAQTFLSDTRPERRRTLKKRLKTITKQRCFVNPVKSLNTVFSGIRARRVSATSRQLPYCPLSKRKGRKWPPKLRIDFLAAALRWTLCEPRKNAGNRIAMRARGYSGEAPLKVKFNPIRLTILDCRICAGA